MLCVGGEGSPEQNEGSSMEGKGEKWRFSRKPPQREQQVQRPRGVTG